MWWLCFYPRSINRLTAIRRPRTDPCERGDRALCLDLSLAASRAGLGRATMQASRVRPDRNGEGKSKPPGQAILMRGARSRGYARRPRRTTGTAITRTTPGYPWESLGADLALPVPADHPCPLRCAGLRGRATSHGRRACSAATLLGLVEPIKSVRLAYSLQSPSKPKFTSSANTALRVPAPV
jgi:hypothetical protein